MRTVLFYRNLKKFHGGHLKVWDYFTHVRSSPEFEAKIAFAESSDWSEANPWLGATEDVVESAADVRPDVFFVAGRDWLMMDRHPAASDEVPVINFVQSVRHADPAGNRYPFLTRKAIRVCVSEVVADAIRETGRTEGPVFTIPNSVDADALSPVGGVVREVDVLVAALKQPERGRELGRRLERPGRRVEVLADRLPRDEYLDRVRRAHATVFLPLETEGFYLPPLEGMALGTLVVCPEHRGEHASYEPGRNCFRPPYTIDDLTAAAESALALAPADVERMRGAARETAEAHSIAGERSAFLEILHGVDELW